MLNDRIEHRWIEAFRRTFALCAFGDGEVVAIVSETQSRPINVQLAEIALQSLGAKPFHLVLPTPAQGAPVPVRSTGASVAIQGLAPVLDALTSCTAIVDCTVEGLLHAPELPTILKSGARVLMVSNEHPDALERLVPDPALKPYVQAAVKKLRDAQQMTVRSDAGTDLTIDLRDTPAVGVWGFTERPGTIAHWPGGIVVTFPKAGSVNGRLVLDTGDMNLTFKRYLESPISLEIKDDYIVSIQGQGTDAELMRRYFAAWGDREAYATSHVGWGMNPAARYEALTLYDQRDTNCTELRAYAGNFLYSTGANEFARRHTEGHFDLPVRACTIALDDEVVVNGGELIDAFKLPANNASIQENAHD